PAPFTVRRALPPRAQLGPPPVWAPALRAAFLGDFGDPTRQQAALAAAVAAAHARAPLDLAFSPGDAVYDCGPDPTVPGAAGCAFGPDGASPAAGFSAPADPRFGRFEARWPALERGGAPVPVWIALGNHDVAAGKGCREGSLPARELQRLRACLSVAHRGPRWRMPARHYAVDAGPARFLVLDSNLLLGDYGGFTLAGEEAFLRDAAAGCEARPCFVVAHHPAASAGGHRREIDDAYVARLRRLQDAAGDRIAGWFAGHDHDLQHLRTPAGYDVFVSGQGSRGRPRERFESVAPPAAQLHYASTAWGFAVLEVWPGAWRVRFEGADGEPLHCCHASFPGGACQPVACPAPAP
ncbi:MAG TPA: metallophosphoesterase, partial [Anaeromyxobacteraceae bacterium]|nr:metallophosphoesterase [Anaeromyxobacteraceae bacterium]